MNVDDVMDKFDDYLDGISPVLIIRIEEEEYEQAAKIRNDINKKIKDIKSFILKNDLTKLNEEDLNRELNKRKFQYLYEWYDIFSIDENKRAYYI